MVRLASFVLLGILLVGCGEGVRTPTEAETTYGRPVEASDAVLARAVAAEDSLYVGHRVTIDGRITSVRAEGCAIDLATEAVPIVVTAAGTGEQNCAWKVPTEAQGFAVAAGTLRVVDDTLRLAANGVRVTPVRLSEPDSQP